MSSRPHLGVETPRGEVTGVALVLHGGRSRSHMSTRANQLAVLRMAPFAARLRRDGARSGLAVARLLYRYRGWNGDERSPVPDTEWALDELARRHPGVPVALVGHSMGGRTALYAAGHRGVRAVVGLAPWIEPGDPVEPLAGRRLLIAHGTADRMTSPDASAAFAQRAARVAASVSYVSVDGEKHAMLRRGGVWHALASGFVLGALYGGPAATAQGTASNDTTNIVVRALAGEASLVV